MSYDICIYFRDLKTGKIQNPYQDEDELLDTSESDETALTIRNTDITQKIYEKYSDVFEIGGTSPTGDIDLYYDEGKKDYGVNIELSQNTMTLYIRFSEIQEDEKSRDKLIEDIVWMTTKMYDCIIDDPQIGIIYIPSRLFSRIKDNFDGIEIVEYKDKGDFRIHDPSFQRGVTGLKRIGIESDISNYAQDLIDQLKSTINLNFSNEGLGNFILVLQDIYDTKNIDQDNEDRESQIRFCGSFFGEHIRQNIPGAKWKYGQIMEDSVVEFFEGGKKYFEIFPYKEVQNIIVNGNTEKNIQNIYKQIEKSIIKTLPFWRKPTFWRIFFGMCIIISIVVKYYKTDEYINNIQVNKSHITHTDILDIGNNELKYKEVIITYNPSTQRIHRPENMSEYKSLSWEIFDAKTDIRLLSRLVHENSYRYYNNRSGNKYKVYLQAHNGKKYVRVSNIIEYELN